MWKQRKVDKVISGNISTRVIVSTKSCYHEQTNQTASRLILAKA